MSGLKSVDFPYYSPNLPITQITPIFVTTRYDPDVKVMDNHLITIPQ